MNDTQQTCATSCGRPTRDVRLLCDQCYWELEKDLSELPALLDELATTLTKQSRISAVGGRPQQPEPDDKALPSGAHVQPLPFNLGASRRLAELRTFLVGWVRDLADTHRHDLPEDDMEDMSRWLYSRMDLIVIHPAAADIYSEITEAVDAVERVVDRPADKLFAGQCETKIQVEGDLGDGLARGGVGYWKCGADLYAVPGATFVICRDCGTRHNAADKRQDILTQLADRLYTAAESARIAAYLIDDAAHRREQTRKLINQWHARGYLVRRGSDRDGSPLFRFGDLMRELAKHQQRHAERVTSEAS